jgi:hypothetical protein
MGRRFFSRSEKLYDDIRSTAFISDEYERVKEEHEIYLVEFF